MAAHLQELIGKPVAFAEDCIGETAEKAAAALEPGDSPAIQLGEEIVEECDRLRRLLGGERSARSHYYAAFVLDADGHNVEAVCHTPV